MSSTVRVAVDSLYNALADHYNEHFAVAHRRAYDQLAWELCSPLWTMHPKTIVDVGCGIGRWTGRLLEAGHCVIGIEPSARMADQSAQRLQPWLGKSFTLRRARVEEVDLPTGSVDVVLAMGSLQYTQCPAEQIARMSSWLRPGGQLAVLVDSLIALVLELSRRGDTEQALERLHSRRGLWEVEGRSAELHLLDTDSLHRAAATAGLSDASVSGLLVGASLWGIDEVRHRLDTNFDAALELERGLAHRPELADLGKQLLLRARRREDVTAS